MVTKSKAGQKKGKVKVGKMNLKKETVKDLTPGEKKQIRGGVCAQVGKGSLTGACFQ
jgi:hypothetical protein